jgi:hypothetical protein
MTVDVRKFLINAFGIVSILAIYIFGALPMGQVAAAVLAFAISSIVFLIYGTTFGPPVGSRSRLIQLMLFALTATVIDLIALYVTKGTVRLTYLSLGAFSIGFFTFYICLKRVLRTTSV